MINFVIGAVLLGIIALSAGYIYREKKKGAKCIGCPYAKECAARRNGTGCGNG